jgi:hypothetical protein
MPIVMFLGENVKDYEKKNLVIIKETLSEGLFRCEFCLQSMKLHSHYERNIKETGEVITINIVWCSKCRKWHALLPDFLLSNKHYSANEIECVIIDSATENVNQIETEASQSTVRRWIKQVSERIERAVGILKYLFRCAGQAINEIVIDPGPCYNELEQVLEKAPSDVKHSGNRLGLANIWIGTNDIKVYI